MFALCLHSYRLNSKKTKPKQKNQNIKNLVGSSAYLFFQVNSCITPASGWSWSPCHLSFLIIPWLSSRWPTSKCSRLAGDPYIHVGHQGIRKRMQQGFFHFRGSGCPPGSPTPFPPWFRQLRSPRFTWWLGRSPVRGLIRDTFPEVEI